MCKILCGVSAVKFDIIWCKVTCDQSTSVSLFVRVIECVEFDIFFFVVMDVSELSMYQFVFV